MIRIHDAIITPIKCHKGKKRADRCGSIGLLPLLPFPIMKTQTLSIISYYFRINEVFIFCHIK
jgi:hypothetical protein